MEITIDDIVKAAEKMTPEQRSELRVRIARVDDPPVTQRDRAFGELAADLRDAAEARGDEPIPADEAIEAIRREPVG